MSSNAGSALTARWAVPGSTGTPTASLPPAARALSLSPYVARSGCSEVLVDVYERPPAPWSLEGRSGRRRASIESVLPSEVPPEPWRHGLRGVGRSARGGRSVSEEARASVRSRYTCSGSVGRRLEPEGRVKIGGLFVQVHERAVVGRRSVRRCMADSVGPPVEPGIRDRAGVERLPHAECVFLAFPGPWTRMLSAAAGGPTRRW